MFSLFNFSSIDAQGETYYIPENIEEVEAYLEAINKKHLKRINGRHASKVRDVFKGRDELVFKQINDSAFFFNTEFDKYVNHVLDEFTLIILQ
ncbi:hypothetical protein Q2T40_05600 [Winogradskyella maritima]|nr:hypothetical protein [Winogradskyella maritima]